MSGTALEVLSTDECMELLRSNACGRIGFAERGLPQVLPVNYRFDDPDIVIRTDPGAKRRWVPQTIVAFEIDGWSGDHMSGWSVVARGPAFDITDTIDPRSVELRGLEVLPWVERPHGVWLKITATELSGRRFDRIRGGTAGH